MARRAKSGALVDTGEALYVEDHHQARDICAEILETTLILGLDTETTGLDIANDRVVLFGLSDGRKRWGFPAECLVDLCEVIEHNEIIKVLTKAKFDAHMLANSGVLMGGPWWDTLVMDWLLDENRRGQHGLKATTIDYGILSHMPSFEETFQPYYEKEYGKKTWPKDRPDLAFNCAPIEVRAEYSTLDPWATFQVYRYLRGELENIMYARGRRHSAWQYFLDVEVPLTRVLWNMERTGVMLDRGYFRDLSEPIQKRIVEIKSAFFTAAGEPININSPKQLIDYFFTQDEEGNWVDEYGNPPMKMTSGGSSGNKQPSTDEETLRVWASKGNEEAQDILQSRSLTKTFGTYVNPIISRTVPI